MLPARCPVISAPQPGDRIRLLKTSYHDGVFVCIQHVKGYDEQKGWAVLIESAPANRVQQVPDTKEIYIVKDEDERQHSFWRPSKYYDKV